MSKKPKQQYDKNAALYDKILWPVENTLSKWRKKLLKDVKETNFQDAYLVKFEQVKK